MRYFLFVHKNHIHHSPNEGAFVLSAVITHADRFLLRLWGSRSRRRRRLWVWSGWGFLGNERIGRRFYSGTWFLGSKSIYISKRPFTILFSSEGYIFFVGRATSNNTESAKQCLGPEKSIPSTTKLFGLATALLKQCCSLLQSKSWVMSILCLWVIKGEGGGERQPQDAYTIDGPWKTSLFYLAFLPPHQSWELSPIVVSTPALIAGVFHWLPLATS